jgi:lysophospholipase L1-like esterase
MLFKAGDTADDLVPGDAPEDVKEQALKGARVPEFDPTLGMKGPAAGTGKPPHRLVVIGDSLTHGFQSGAVYNTDLSYGAIIAHELGWLDQFRFPRYPGHGGLPLNIELLLRDLESHLGSTISGWELPMALFRAREFMDGVEDYWERGAGKDAPVLSAYNHALAVYGWDLRDALSRNAAGCAKAITEPKDDLLSQVIENNSERAALRVYPHWDTVTEEMSLFQAAAELGKDKDASTDCGIETLVVFLGANNALRTVTDLKVAWSQDADYADLAKKGAYTVWTPKHFKAELDEVVKAVRAINARHVIWCTVPHVTIAPIARGVGDKLKPGSRYFPFYTRPWVKDADFSSSQDQHITGQEARAVDCAIDLYNEAIQEVVHRARGAVGKDQRDWYLLDIAGILDRLATRRYIKDPNAQPDWWTPYPLPAVLKALDPVPDSRFLTGNGQGGRATGGIFSLDGVHPTTVGYGLIAQEVINVMRLAGVEFRHDNGQPRSDPVTVDFDRLILRDTLIRQPPQNLKPGLDMLGWADETLDWVRRTLTFRA